jgi:hypothetical protein
MFLYNDSKNSLFKKPSLVSSSSLYSELAIAAMKSNLKKSSEY